MNQVGDCLDRRFSANFRLMQPASTQSAIEPREHFIPLRPTELMRKLADESAVTIFERQQFLDLCQLATAIVHHECHAYLLRLLEHYEPFHPDCDAARQFIPTEAQQARSGRRIFAEFETLLTRANYRQLTPGEIARAVQPRGTSGLRLVVDLSIFERLDVYVRGECVIAGQSKRRGRTSSEAAPPSVPAYRRMAMIFRLNERKGLDEPANTRSVVLKLFKDIPRDDLEALLPGAKVQIGIVDQAKIVLPTISGLAFTLLKILKGAAAVAFASVYGLAAFLGLVGGAVGYGVKSFFGYLQVRERHQLTLMRQLYYQNLDNNAGVIYHLVAEAEEQELRELVLGWWLLWRGGMAGATAEQIDRAAEEWLSARCGVEVDFEVTDALAKLKRFGLAFESASGRWRAVAIEEALTRLDRYWDDRFACRRKSAEAEDVTPPRIYRRAA